MFAAAALLYAALWPAVARQPATPPAASSVAAPAGGLVRDLPRAFGRLAAPRNLLILGLSGASAEAVHGRDADLTNRASGSPTVDRLTEGGSIVGNGYVQAGGAIAALVIGRVSHHPAVTRVGTELVEAQLVNGALTEALKLSVRRTRPDGGRYSFPSGHSSATFATAAVLDGEFGWKIGVPAYALGTYVAASRLHDRRHFASDVIVGAGLGLVAGRVSHARLTGTRVSAGIVPLLRGVAVTGTISCPW